MELYTHQKVGNTEERKDEAIRTIRSGVTVIGDILKSTLGPRGSLKMLQGKKLIVSNDGACILKNLLIENASSKIVINSSVNQDWEEGDGTTSIAILTSLLVNEGYKLNIPTNKIIKGYSLALSKCLEVLNKRKFTPKAEDIRNLVKTTINSKVLYHCMDLFVDMCINAIECTSDLELIEIIKLKGDLKESVLVDGLVINKSVDIDVIQPKILIGNTSMDYDKVKINSAKTNVSGICELKRIEIAEKEKMRRKIDEICSIEYDVFINRQIVYDYPLELLRKKKIAVIEHADFSGVEKLNKVVGGNILSSFSNIQEKDLGRCERIRNITIKGQKMIKFEGIKKGACTMIIFGSSEEVLDEAERSIHDGLCVLKRIKESRLCLYGGSSTEMAMSVELARLGSEVKGKEAEGIFGFSNALQEISKILSDNSGFDGEEFKVSLRNEHNNRRTSYGLNIDTGKTCCMKERGIIEGYEMKKRVITSACETAQMILRCDGIVKCKARERTEEHCCH